MAEHQFNQNEINEQLTVFKAAIHEPSLEGKGRLLQHHQELINIVNYYDDAVKSHAPANKEFWDSLNSGKYEQMLVDSIKRGQLNMYDPPAEFQVKSNLSLTNKAYDKKGEILQGFDIDLGDSKKSLHVDLKNAAVETGKTLQEVKQSREDYYDVYQATIKNNPEMAEKYFNKIAEKFPNGISWQSPSEKQPSESVLVMHGQPNLAIIVSPKFGELFLDYHSQSAVRPKHIESDVHSLNVTEQQPVNLSNNQSDGLTPAQAVIQTYLSHVATLPKEQQEPHIKSLKDFDLKAIEDFVNKNIPLNPNNSQEDQVLIPKTKYSVEIDQGIFVRPSENAEHTL